MTTTLNYGQSATCSLDSADAIHLRPDGGEALKVAEIASQVQARLSNPPNFPPLAEITIPGDVVVIAAEPGIPQLTQVLSGVLKAMPCAGDDEAEVSILVASTREDADALTEDLRSMGHTRFSVKRHDPDDEDATAFLGVSREGHGIRLNRLLCDADFVLPIGVTKSNPLPEAMPNCQRGPYPVFSDRETIKRIALAGAEYFPATAVDNAREVDDCGRFLGAQFSLQVVPHREGGVASIIAGETDAVLRQAEVEYRKHWQVVSPVRGSLVIATISGSEDQQTWTNCARALSVAMSVLETDGSIVLCTELSEPPGEAICKLAGIEDPLLVEREILKTPSADCGPAMVLCRALQHASVYLRSNLRSDVVESLGMTPLESDSELERLAQSMRPCIVLEESQYLLPMLAHDQGDDEEDTKHGQ